MLHILCTVHIFKSAWVFYHWLNRINNKNYCNILLNIKIFITFSTINIRALINIGEDLWWISQEMHYTYFKQERTMSLYTCIHYLHPAAQEPGLTKWHMVVVCWLVLWTSSLIFYFQNSSFLNYLLASAPEHWTCNLFTHLRSLCSNLNKWASSRLSFNTYETESLHTHCKYSFIHCKYLYGWVLMLSASLLIWNQDLRHFGPDFCNLLISTSSLCKLV